MSQIEAYSPPAPTSGHPRRRHLWARLRYTETNTPGPRPCWDRVAELR
jgi:hypothetical protein